MRIVDGSIFWRENTDELRINRYFVLFLGAAVVFGASTRSASSSGSQRKCGMDARAGRMLHQQQTQQIAAFAVAGTVT